MVPAFACLVMLASLNSVYAQAAAAPISFPTAALSHKPIVPAQFNGDVRALPPVYLPQPFVPLNEGEPPPDRKPPYVPAQNQAQAYAPLAPMPAPYIDFRGLTLNTQLNGVGSSLIPPDTNGDVGTRYYIQAVNVAFGIFDKTSGALVAGFTENQLWAGAGTGTPCDTSNDGDPVVLYDARAQRWILTDFSVNFSSAAGPSYECIAVSKTSDPVAGGYWLYAVRTDTGANGAPPVGTAGDYPKFGLWTDCLYMGANGFQGGTKAYVGAVFAAFDRTALYSGAALTGSNSSIGFIASTSDFFTVIPANLLGPDADSLPPNGTPEYFVYESNSNWTFEVGKFTNGPSACGTGSSLGQFTGVNETPYALAVSSDIVTQPYTSDSLDSLEDRLMQRVNYRRIGSNESLWVVHTTGNSVAQPQWAQIDVTGGVVATTPVQQEIYAPDNTVNRWMASVATDRFGNMAMGYSISSSTIYPGIVYAGRLVDDTSNQLPQGEVYLMPGGGAQNVGSYRWGDYSAMTVDPQDDCTFWYTSEYYDTQASGDTADWHTRIGAFRFPGCTTRTTQTIQFTSTAPAGLMLGDPPAVVTATASSGLAVTLTVDPASTAVCALSGNSSGSLVSYLGYGTCTIDANQFGDSTYRAAQQIQQSFDVAPIFRNGFEGP